MFLNLRLQIVHSTGRSGMVGLMIVEVALLPSVFAATEDEILGLDDLIRNDV